MTFALALVVAGVLVPPVFARSRRWGVVVMLVLVGGSFLLEAAAPVDIAWIGRLLERMDLPGQSRASGEARLQLLGALVWCGPAADVVVRLALDATGLPTVQAAADAGLRAGRWIGRLERWLLLVCVAGGVPALAVLPVGGKALLRYAEVMADARAETPRIEPATDVAGSRVTRGALIDYVIVGSLASWTQAITLALLAGSV